MPTQRASTICPTCKLSHCGFVRIPMRDKINKPSNASKRSTANSITVPASGGFSNWFSGHTPWLFGPNSTITSPPCTRITVPVRVWPSPFTLGRTFFSGVIPSRSFSLKPAKAWAISCASKSSPFIGKASTWGAEGLDGSNGGVDMVISVHF